MTRQIIRTGRTFFILLIADCIVASFHPLVRTRLSIRWSNCSDRPPMVVSRDPFARLRTGRSIEAFLLHLHYRELVEGLAYPNGLVNQHLSHLFLARDHPQSRQA